MIVMFSVWLERLRPARHGGTGGRGRLEAVPGIPAVFAPATTSSVFSNSPSTDFVGSNVSSSCSLAVKSQSTVTPAWNLSRPSNGSSVRVDLATMGHVPIALVFEISVGGWRRLPAFCAAGGSSRLPLGIDDGDIFGCESLDSAGCELVIAATFGLEITCAPGRRRTMMLAFPGCAIRRKRSPSRE